MQAAQSDHPDACLHLAQVARLDRDFIAAEHFLRLGLSGAHRLGLRAEAAPLFAELSAYWRAQANPLEALKHARGAQSICGEVPILIWEESEALRELGRTMDRVLRLNRLAALQPNDPVVLVELGLALMCTSSAPQALKPLRAALAMGYSDDEVSLSVANLELHCGNSDKAESLLRLILTKDPTHLGALGQLWVLLRRQCRWSEAGPIERRIIQSVQGGNFHAALTPFMLMDSDVDALTLRRYASRFSHGDEP